MKTRKPTRIVYILGHGRSGSTVLDLFLSASSVCTSIGQFGRLPRLDARLKDEIVACSCGEKVQECVAWEHLFEDLSLNKPLYYDKKNLFFDNLARMRSSLKVLAILVSRKILRLDDIYIDHQQCVLNDIASINRSHILVDSSKSILRLLSLNALKGIEIDTIFLYRSMNGVIGSKAKGKSGNSAGSTLSGLSWFVQNLLCGFVFRNLKGRKIVVSYDDFTENPENVLNFVFPDTETPFKAKDPRNINLSGTHMISGNSIKNESDLYLSPTKFKNPRINFMGTVLYYSLGKPLEWWLRTLNSNPSENKTD